MPKEIMRKKLAEIEQERKQVVHVLDQAMHREEELEKLAETEREMRERIEATDNDLEDMTSQKRRELYQDLRVRVEVGESKRPQIWGIFRTIHLARTEGSDEQHKVYVVKADTSQRHVGSLTGPIDPLTRIVGSGACPERDA